MKNKTQAIEAIKSMTFGIEIECMFPTQLAIDLGIRTTARNWSDPLSMSHITNTNGASLTDWEASWDQTITRREGYTPIEFNSKILSGEQGWASVEGFFKWLADCGAKVDASCGLHIHLGIKEMVRDMDIDQSIEAILKSLKFANSIKTAIFAQAGSARRFFESRWARTRTSHLRQDAETQARHNEVPSFGGKYFFVNTMNIANNGINGRKATIEFRAFAGTLNYLKVLGHLFTCFIVVYAGMRYSRSSWEGRNQTADKGLIAYNAIVRTWGGHDMFKSFPTFQANKRKIFKMGRNMATKFTATSTRWANNGRFNLSNYR